MPFVTVRPKSAFVVVGPLAAALGDRLRAATSIDSAPYAAYGFGVVPICLPKLLTNVAPAPVSAFGGSPATLMYAPLPTAPFAFGSLKPSGICSWIFGSTDLMSCISFAPLLHTMPPRKTACAPDALIWVASAS